MEVKEKIIKCPGCGFLIYADKVKMDEHFVSGHQKNVYTATESTIPQRPQIIGMSTYRQILGMLNDYPKGILAWTGIVLIATLVLSLLRFSK